MRGRAAAVAACAVVGLVLAGCADPVEPDDELSAEVSAVPSPSPSAAPASEPAPSERPSPDASPSPSPSPSPAAALVEEEALAAARARRAERGDCDEGAPDDGHRVLLTGEDRMLVHVVCFVGAYQSSGELRLWDGVELAPLTVEQWQFGGVLDTPEVTGFLTPGPDGTTVTNDVKYRGLGDCGLFQRWGFDGRRLQLELAREQECSDDGEFVPPDQWPVVFER